MEYSPHLRHLGYNQDVKFIHLPHCVYHSDYHIVIVTKYRKAIFNEGIFAYLKLKLAEITEHYPLIQFKEVSNDKDHIHLLVSIPPTMSVGKAIGLIKQNTAKELKQKFPFLKEVYWGTQAIWSEGYFVSTVGVNEQVIRKYIQEQGEEDSGQTLFEIS
jgi:putative transposase